MHNLNNYRLDTEWNDLYRSHKYFEEPKTIGKEEA